MEGKAAGPLNIGNAGTQYYILPMHALQCCVAVATPFGQNLAHFLVLVFCVEGKFLNTLQWVSLSLLWVIFCIAKL